MTKRLGYVVAGLAVIGLVFGALVVFGWTIGETRFDRPDEDFDRLTAQLESMPGASVDDAERWVEAPTFSDPTSWIELTVDEAGLPGLLAAACTTGYTETLSWSLRMRTGEGGIVSGHAATAPSDASGGASCPDLGFDAVDLVDAVGDTVPGLALQPSIRNDRFALVATEEPIGGIAGLLPLVAHAHELRDAAGLDAASSVEIDAGDLMLIIEPDEHDGYLALLSDLIEEHGVASYWADGADSQTDGVAKVQIVAPDREHAAIENRIRASGLTVADYPIRFIPLEP